MAPKRLLGFRSYGIYSAPRLSATYRRLNEPLSFVGKKATKEVTDPRQPFEDILRSSNQIFIQTAASTPTVLVNAMANVAKEKDLRDIETMHILIGGPLDSPLGAPGMSKHVRMCNFFIGAGHGARNAMNRGEADFIPVFLSEIPLLFRKGARKVDIALISVSPPDKHGYCSLGPSVDCGRAALQVADVIIAQVNNNVPRTFGDGASMVESIACRECGRSSINPLTCHMLSSMPTCSQHPRQPPRLHLPPRHAAVQLTAR